VTDAVLKALRTELPIERAREVFAHLTGGRGEEYPSLEFIQPMGRGRNGTPPRRRKPLPLLELAAAYAKHVANGHRSPVRATADELNYAPRYASKRIADARESGWLTPTSQRKASGVLTEEARSILARHPGDRQSPLA
jgi:hypothetical protein